MKKLLGYTAARAGLFLLVGLGSGFLWLEGHPESPFLEKAESWPVVGALASSLREGEASPSEETEVAEAETEAADGATSRRAAPERRRTRASEPKSGSAAVPSSAETSSSGAQPPAAGSSLIVASEGRPAPESTLTLESVLASVDAEAERKETATRRRSRPPSLVRETPIPWIASEWVWVMPGNQVRGGAASSAESLRQLGAMAYLPVLERRQAWAKVIFDGEPGWVDTAWQPPFNRKKSGRGVLRRRYEPVTASDSRRLKKAQEILGVGHGERMLGAYALYSNVEDQELLDFLDRAASEAEEAYFARYGRVPSGDPKRSVVLFATEANYRTYAEETSNFEGGGTQAGHAGAGILAFYKGNQTRETLARILVHEIGHLLNARSIAQGMPPWMEEGIASDLGSLWIEHADNIASNTSPSPRGRFRSFRIASPEVRFLYLGEVLAVGQLPSVEVLWSLDYKTFHSEKLERYAYAHSAALIRYLLDGENGRLADGFRAYLKQIALGSGGQPRFLLKKIGMSVEELDQGLQDWLRAENRASQERMNRRVAAARGAASR